MLHYCIQELKELEEKQRTQQCQQLKEQAKKLNQEAKSLEGRGVSDEIIRQIEDFNESIDQIQKENNEIKNAHETFVLQSTSLASAR